MRIIQRSICFVNVFAEINFGEIINGAYSAGKMRDDTFIIQPSQYINQGSSIVIRMAVDLIISIPDVNMVVMED
jgi:hypothetical protein